MSGQGMQKIIFTLLLSALSLVQISCTTEAKPSILVIAVDQLSTSSVSCSSDFNERSGFQLLCNESIRFTHAFTPSVLSTPAITSLATGLYPYEHKVRHNSAPELAPEFETVAEVAYKKNYRTSFFSGGAPVFRRSGLNQGFEVFEDNIVPSFTQLFSPFKNNSTTFLNWLSEDVGTEPFFTMIYVPDLLYTSTETTTDLGETRNLSFESQLDEFDESLYELILNMRAENQWDRTTVILVGLNGHYESDRKELPPLNLHSENTQVALLVKPAQSKKRDEAIHWKIDQNVSLVDVGKTLFELLGQSVADTQDDGLTSYSLLNVLKNPTPQWPENRAIMLESGWAFWRKAGPVKSAFVGGHVLYINNENPKLFNTLVDRYEFNPLPLLQESILPITRNLEQVIQKNRFVKFPPLEKEWNAKLSIPYARWIRPDQEALLLKDLKRLTQLHPNSLDLANWTAQIALNQKDWETLKSLADKNKVSIWQYVAEKNLNSRPQKNQDPCFALLGMPSLETEQLKNCSDALFLEFIDWARADLRGLAKETQRKRFERSFKNYLLDQFIQRNNIAAGLIWDTSRENIFAPSRTELALSLPENSRLRAQVYKSVLKND